MGLAPVAQSLGLAADGPPSAVEDGRACGLGGLRSVVLDPTPALFTFIVAGWGLFYCIFSNTIIWEMCNSAFNNF